MKIFDLCDAARAELRQMVPSIAINDRMLLIHYSEAIQKLQAATRALHCECLITLDQNNRDGRYNMPSELKFHSIDYIWYDPFGPSPIHNANGQSGIPGFRVPLIPYDQWLNLSANGILNPQSSAYIYSDWQTQAPNAAIIASVRDRIIYIWPVGGATGGLKVHYVPELEMYGPNSPEWAAFGQEPSKRMQREEVQPEFRSAIPGIKAYIKAKLIATHPEGLRAFKPFYEQWMAEFGCDDTAANAVTKERTEYTMYQPPAGNFGGMF